MTTYSEKLKDPRWQKKRLEILQRDDFTCRICKDTESTLMVHHKTYLKDTEPWDYPDNYFVTLCESCHESEKEQMNEAMGYLIEDIKLKFPASDVLTIACAFNNLDCKHGCDLTANAISYAFQSDEIMDYLVEKYLNRNVKHG